MRPAEQIKRIISTAFLFFVLGSISLPAQEIHLSISKDTIGIDETVTLTMKGETSTDISAIEDPKIQGMSIIGTSDNTNFDINNGKVKLERTYTLLPFQTGKFTFGPGKIRIGSHQVLSNTVSIVVTSSGGSANEPAVKSSGSADAFLRCEPDKKKLVLGEQAVFTLRLYSQDKVFSGDLNSLTSDPFNGFYYYRSDLNPAVYDSMTSINGVPYHVIPIYKGYIFPNKTGKLFIPSFRFTCSIMKSTLTTGDPFIDSQMQFPVEVNLASDPVPIEVSDVPDKNKPAGFQGDVGEFSLNSSIDKSQVKANEPVVLTVAIHGKGNIEFLRFPDTKFPDEFESFPPTASDTITQTQEGITGEKKFQVTLIPKNAGNFTIPGITFSYYDPEKKDFVTLKTPEFQLKVNPADPTKNITENNLPESFLDTKSYSKLVWKIIFIAVPPLLLILLLIFLARRKKKKQETEEALQKKEEEENITIPVIEKKSIDIQRMLAVAENTIVAGKTKAGVAQLYETLYTALCQKTELTREEASINQMRFRLELKHFSKEFASEILDLLQELSTLRYSNDPLDMAKLAETFRKTRKLAMDLV